jgi:GNAT superfamily N-acetyltransferase
MIALARVEDVSRVVALLAVQMAEHAVDIARERIEHAVRGMLADGRRGVILVAREGEADVVGLAWVSFTWSLEHGGLTSWLEELYVVPERRERGLGRELLLAAQEAARAAGCAATDLEVDVDHRRAENLYEREGYRRLPRGRWVRRLG